MTLTGWLQIALILGLVALTARPLGLYMARVFSGERTFLSPVLAPVERSFYALAGVSPEREQSWLSYTLAMLAFSAAGFASLYAILRLQAWLPLNPQGFDGVAPDLAFNTAISFLTNTNWQAYGGETTMSHFSQMAGLTVHNFLSAATGIALAIAVTRAFARASAHDARQFLGRCDPRHALCPAAAGFRRRAGLSRHGRAPDPAGSFEATTLEGAKQVISLGPMAGQEAIKQLGTNGGGFFNANSAHPFENPNAFANMLQIWSMLAISTALLITFGKMVGDERQGWTLISAVGILLVAAAGVVYWAETAGNPLLTSLGLDPSVRQYGRQGSQLRHRPCPPFLRRSPPACPAARSTPCMIP